MNNVNNLNNSEVIETIVSQLNILPIHQLEKVSSMIEESVIDDFSNPGVHKFLINVDDQTFKTTYCNIGKTKDISINDNGIVITIIIHELPLKLINFSLARIRLMGFYNKINKKGLGHKVLCQLLKEIIRRNIISEDDDISWEVEPGSYKQMDSLVNYYKKIGAYVLNKDYEETKKVKGSIYMGASIKELMKHCNHY